MDSLRLAGPILLGTGSKAPHAQARSPSLQAMSKRATPFDPAVSPLETLLLEETQGSLILLTPSLLDENLCRMSLRWSMLKGIGRFMFLQLYFPVYAWLFLTLDQLSPLSKEMHLIIHLNMFSSTRARPVKTCSSGWQGMGGGACTSQESSKV